MDHLSFLGPPDGMFLGLPWYGSPPRDEGHDCPACGRLLKIYRRRLSRSMTRSLIRLYKLTLAHPEGSGFFHVKQFDKEKARGEFGVLSGWGLVAEKENTDPEKKTSGMWSITHYGMRFVIMKETLPQYVILQWGSRLLGFAGPMVNVKDCLEHGNRFKYDELMATKDSDMFF